jgi:hypothetical protein
MKEPRRISFPKVVDPATRQECLVIFAKPILDARGPSYSPSQVYCLGFAPDGNHYGFSVPCAVYEAAAREPAHFIELDTIRAPSAVIVDPAGQPFTSPGSRESS